MFATSNKYRAGVSNSFHFSVIVYLRVNKLVHLSIISLHMSNWISTSQYITLLVLFLRYYELLKTYCDHQLCTKCVPLGVCLALDVDHASTMLQW